MRIGTDKAVAWVTAFEDLCIYIYIYREIFLFFFLIVEIREGVTFV